TYYYYITAYNSAGESPKSNEVNATPHKPVIWIHNIYQLEDIGNDLSGNYALANDINATITRTWNGGNGFEPIGNPEKPFTGVLDGRGHKIINLYINRSWDKYLGLFGYVSRSAVIENIHIENANVTGKNYDGALAGYNEGAITNCSVTGSVRGNWYVGGLVGENSGNMRYCNATVDVNGTFIVGGLVGDNMGRSSIPITDGGKNFSATSPENKIIFGELSHSKSEGHVSGVVYVGGLVGENGYYGKLLQSQSVAEVNGDGDIGGLVGINCGYMNNTAYTGNVSGYGDVGGLAGSNNGNLNWSYTTCNVSGASEIGGVAGENTGIIEKITVVGEITGQNEAGGAVGNNENFIENTQFRGLVRGGNFTGGLAGKNTHVIKDSHSSGTVLGYNYTGGIIGLNGGMLINSYTSGNITGDNFVGGLAGFSTHTGMVINSYYDVDSVLINGAHYLSVGGIYDEQYRRWLSNGLHLNISDYSSTLSPAGKYYEISSVQGLKDMLGFSESNFSFRLTANLSLSSEPNFYIPYFSGVFDGNNHTISDVYINKSLEGNIGLFGYNIGTVKNLGVVNENISGNFSVGGLVGSNEGFVYGSYTSGKVTGYYNVGGLVGANYGDDTGSGILNSSSIATVIGKRNVGGLVGYNVGAINASYSEGMVKGDFYVGGFVGMNNGTITNSYTMDNATGQEFVGGFAGTNNGTLLFVYSAGRVNETPYYSAGGLVASNIGNITASFWDINSSGDTWSDGGIGKTTAEMKNKTTFTSAGWDFENIWAIKDGKTYPYLKWQAPSRDFTEKKLYSGSH
ncbi:MAG: hypothetical protein GXO25_05065, partial [Euryarchaeota archaeon]|nr:hypothetical protein [Euryarchaeota archaeon]